MGDLWRRREEGVTGFEEGDVPFNNCSDKLCAPCVVLRSCEVGGVTTRLLAPRPERGAWKCKPERDEVERMSSTKATSNSGDVECQTGLGPCSGSVCYLPVQNSKISNSTPLLLGAQRGANRPMASAPPRH